MGGEDAGEEVKGPFLYLKTYLYSSTVMMVVECFFRQLCALWGESVVRKYWTRSVLGVVGRQDDVALFVKM